jgi:phage gp29-like protein
MASTPTGEIATTRSDPFLPSFQTTMQPTDEVLVANGGTSAYRVYDEIRRDPHAHAILQKRKLEVVSREWQVFEASERRIDKKIAGEVEQSLKAINFDQLTRGLLGAILKGFSVAEILWVRDGSRWVPSAVKVKKQRRFRFDIDGRLRMLTRSSPIEGVELPDRKFIVHRHSIDDDDDDPYGVGLGSVLFWPAWFKRQVLANWLQATRKHAAPTTLAQYQGAYDSKKQDLLAEAMNAMQASDSLIVPENVVVSLLEAKGGGSPSEQLARYLDELMSEAVLGETLTTNSGERGARSLGEVHNEIRVAIAKADADLVCQSIRDTLVRWYVELNYPGEAVPNVWRDFSEAEDLNDKVERDKTIYEMGYKPASVDYLNETYGGEWIERQVAEPDTDAKAADDTVTSGLAFADPVRPETAAQKTVNELSGQMEEFGRPIIAAMIGDIRAAFADATSYDDLIERLARLSGDLSIDELAQLMSQGTVLADLEGRASADD